MILTSNGVHDVRRAAKSRGPRSTRNRFRPMVLDRLEARLLLASTTLAVAAASGTYGGNTDLLVHLTSGGNNVSGEIIDFQMGGNELGTTVTDANGLAVIDNVSIAGNNVGTYTGDITAEFTGDAGAGFTASSGANDLTVTTAPLTITANNLSKVYGAALPTLTASYTGLVNGDTSASLATPPTITTTATAASHFSGSPYSITASGAVDTNYSISYVDGSLSVTKAPLTITANNLSKVYGAALPTLTASYTGFVNSDTSANLATPPTITTTATAASHFSGSPYTITASAAVDTDYTISYVGGTLSVTKAPLTITANNLSKVYGAALPTLTASYTGLVNGDTSANLTTPPTITTTATAASLVSGSPYSITASAAADTDYTISYVAGTLAVTTAPLTITANNLSKVYGAALPTLTASYTGLVNGDTSANLSTPPTISTTATAASLVSGSPYSITASGAVDTNYTISYVTGSLAVTTAPLTITANNLSKVYGAALPTLTASYTGFVNSDTSANLTTQPTITTSATAASLVSGSPYAITASAAVDTNYTISYVAGTLAVTTAPLTITANNQTKVYGAALPGLNASYTGFVNGDTSANLATQPTITTTATVFSPVSGSPYSITASGAVDTNYTISYVAGSLSLTAAPLTITVDDQSKVYGQANPTLTGTVTGILNGDNVVANYSTSAAQYSDVVLGGYPITLASLTGTKASDYSIIVSGGSETDGTLTVTPATLNLFPYSTTIVYGQVPTLTGIAVSSGEGAVNGDVFYVNFTSAGQYSDVVAGGYNIVYASLSGAKASDYSTNHLPGDVFGIQTVTAAPLTIVAANASKVYGQANPTFTGTVTGVLNGDNVVANYSTTASQFSDVVVGGYPIALASLTGTKALDYSTTVTGGSETDGVLSITQAPLTIAVANASKVYGQANPTLTGTVTGVLNGDNVVASFSSTAAQFSDVVVGGYPIMLAGLSGSKAIDYATTVTGGSETDGILTVTQAPLTIAVANQSKVYGQANPTLTGAVTGILNGDNVVANYATAASQFSDVVLGGYPITLASLSGTKAIDYSTTVTGGSETDGALTVTQAPITVVIDNQSKIYGHLNPTLTGTVTGVLNGDNVVANYSTSAGQFSDVAVGGYPIGLASLNGGPKALDYSTTVTGGSETDGILTVTQAPLTIAVANQSKVYGQANPTLTGTVSGILHGDNVIANYQTSALPSSGVVVGGYPITLASLSGTKALDYSTTVTGGSVTPGALTVTAAPLTITADNTTKVYGSALPTLTASYTGLVNGDTAANLLTPPTITTTATASSHVSSLSGNPFAVTASGAVDSNYSISYLPGSLTVTPAPLTISANDQTKLYGAALPAFTASYTGLVNGDTSANLLTLPTLSTNATAASHVSGSPYAINAIGAVDPDYTIGYATGNLSITPVALTITANDSTKLYGAALPTFTASYLGFVNGDTSASLATLPTITSTGTAGSHVSGSPYAINASSAIDTDYTISYVAGSLAVTTAPLTITADTLNKVYGDPLPVLTASYTGLVNGDTSASLSTSPMLTTTADAASHVAGSPYAITASGAADTDYTISYAAGSLNVTAAPLTITADNQTKVYGAALPTLTASYTGFVNGDTSASLIDLPSLGTTATSGSNVSGSPYAITASGASAGDYAVTYVAGNLDVTKAPLQVTANNVSTIFGQAVPTLTASYAGFVNGDSASSLTTPVSLTTTASSTSNVNSYPVVASGATSGNYNVSYTSGTASVTPATLTVTPNNLSSVFGSALPSLTASYSGFVNGNTAASLTTPVTLSTTATSASNFGSYPITASGGSSPNYDIVDGHGTLTIAGDPVQVAFVTSLYQNILGRAPETSGLESFLLELSNGDGQADVVNQVYNSSEAVADRTAQGVVATPQAAGQIGLVTALYQTILGRTPETAGLDGWLAQLKSGVSPASVANAIYNSPEAVADRAAATPPTAPTSTEKVGLVTALYQTILGRTPDPSGLAGWLAELNNGTSAASVASQIESSPEAVALKAKPTA
jgi:MBG domain (YGX type)/Domain of unknown function (DUF4214)